MLKKTLASMLTVGLGMVAINSVNAAVVYDNGDTSLDVGGRLQVNLNSVEATKEDKAAIEGAARWRVKGESKIVDGLKAIAFAEWQVASETSNNGKFDTRFAYVGVKSSDYGQLVFGQNHTALFNVLTKTDLFVDWGKKGNTYWDLGGRQEGQAVYQYDKNGLLLGASYQSAGLDKVDSGFALSAGYEMGKSFPIALALGYDQYDIKSSSDDKQSFAASVSGGTHGEGLYLAGMYQLTAYEDSKDKTGFELVSSYTFENDLQFILSYQSLEQDNARLVSSFVGEASYKWNTNFKTYVEAEVGAGDIDKVDTLGRKIGSTDERSADKISLGLQYNF